MGWDGGASRYPQHGAEFGVELDHLGIPALLRGSELEVHFCHLWKELLRRELGDLRELLCCARGRPAGGEAAEGVGEGEGEGER